MAVIYNKERAKYGHLTGQVINWPVTYNGTPDDASIKKKCLKENMVTLRRDGVNKILYGFTTFEEILSITSP